MRVNMGYETPVLSSCRAVASGSGLVCFHPEKIGPAVDKWGHLLDAAPSWDHPCHFFDGTPETVRWIFTLDVLNHCFWPDPGEAAWSVRYKGEDRSGYWGLAAALKRGLETDFPVTNPAWLSNIGAEELEAVLASTPAEKPSRIPLFSERLRNLREAGSIILSELGGDIVTLLKIAGGSAARLASEVVRHFPSFRDEADYGGARVFFWKRAQIFAADLHCAFGGEGPGSFNDIGALTAFADYKLPQVLRELGIISYRPELAHKVDSLAFIDPGSAYEVEIRAMTVVAVDEIRKIFEDRNEQGAATGSTRPVTSAGVDSWLWRLGQMDEFRKHPYHRCRTIFY